MQFKTLIVPLFLLMVSVQLYVPASMIWSKEKVIKEGSTYKFKVAPVDPNDPFRGKYVVINVAANHITEVFGNQWEENEAAYVVLGTDLEGYAQASYLTKQEPLGTDYIRVKIDRIAESEVYFDYPFNRFYMDEDKASIAELLYFESLRDTTSVTYALVMVNNGAAVLQDVRINDVSLVDLAEIEQEYLKLH